MITHPLLCHCGDPATHQAHRDATDDETAANLAAMDSWRTAQGLDPLPADAAIRTATHSVPVFTCCPHTDDCPCGEA